MTGLRHSAWYANACNAINAFNRSCKVALSTWSRVRCLTSMCLLHMCVVLPAV